MFIATGIVGGRNTRVVYRGTQVIGSNASSYSFGSFNGFGPESQRRHIVAGFNAASLGANTSKPACTAIGGITPTEITSIPTGAQFLGNYYQLWIAAVPTNVDETMQFSRGGSMTHGLIDVWSIYDLISATPFHVLHGTVANPSVGDLNAPSGGVGVGFCRILTAGTFTWGGLLEDQDGAGSGTAAGTIYTGASKSKLAAGTLAVSCAHSATNVQFIAASFR